jgi:hypothetical protein
VSCRVSGIHRQESVSSNVAGGDVRLRRYSTADSKTAAKPKNTVSIHLLTLLMTPVALDFQQVMKKSSNSFKREKRERE